MLYYMAVLMFLAQNMDVNFTYAHRYYIHFVQYVLPYGGVTSVCAEVRV